MASMEMEANQDWKMSGNKRVVMQQHNPPSKKSLKKQGTRETPVTNGY